MRHAVLAFPLFVASIAPAQTYVVDAASGPGASFTSIAAATAAVPDGSVLLVRAGTYASFTIDNKGIAVLADPGVVVTSPAIDVQNTTAVQPVVLRNLVLDASYGLIRCTSCAGPVLLDQILPASYSPFPFPPPARLELTQCTQVVATSSGFNGAGFFSAVMATSSQFVLIDSVAGAFITAGIEAHASRVQVVSSQVWSSGYASAVAIVADAASDVRLLGNTTVSAQGHSVLSNATVRIAPTVTLNGPVQASSTTIIDDERLTGSGGALGGNVTATLTGANGNLAVLFLGVTGPPLFVPGIIDSWWLDPAISASVAVAVLNVHPVVATVAIPPTPALQGLTFGFQGLFLTPTGLSVSNPYRFVIQ